MTTKSKKGFTIIEVVLVLAIAGLIFLMVFIALPNMQRSQRDTQRRNDYAAFSANMTSYMTNNNGRLPTGAFDNDAVNANSCDDTDARKYINDTGEDPNGYCYQMQNAQMTDDNNVPNLTATDRNTPSTVYLIRNAVCNDGTPQYSASKRAFAIYGNLETGNGTYCQSNS